MATATKNAVVFIPDLDAALAARPAPVVSEEQVRAMRSRIAALVNPTGDPNPAWDIAVASIIHEVLAALGVATTTDEGERTGR